MHRKSWKPPVTSLNSKKILSTDGQIFGTSTCFQNKGTVIIHNPSSSSCYSLVFDSSNYVVYYSAHICSEETQTTGIDFLSLRTIFLFSFFLLFLLSPFFFFFFSPCVSLPFSSFCTFNLNLGFNYLYLILLLIPVLAIIITITIVTNKTTENKVRTKFNGRTS